MTTVEILPLTQEPEYPESDGQPMGETEFHQEEMFNGIKALQRFFRDQPDIYVAGNLFLYYEKGDSSAVVAPDVFVVKGVSKEKRRTYKLWEEGQAPCFAIEVTSEHTRKEDTGSKMDKYAQLGVAEVFRFDPLGEYLSPTLQGFRLVGGGYQKISPAADGSLVSETLGLILQSEGDQLRLRDRATGEPLLWVDEVEAGWEQEKAARQAAEDRAQAAEDRNQALEEELARLKRQLDRAQE